MVVVNEHEAAHHHGGKECVLGLPVVVGVVLGSGLRGGCDLVVGVGAVRLIAAGVGHGAHTPAISGDSRCVASCAGMATACSGRSSTMKMTTVDLSTEGQL